MQTSLLCSEGRVQAYSAAMMQWIQIYQNLAYRTPHISPDTGKASTPDQARLSQSSPSWDSPEARSIPTLSAQPSHLLSAPRLEQCSQSLQVRPLEPGFPQSLFPYTPASPCLPFHYPRSHLTSSPSSARENWGSQLPILGKQGKGQAWSKGWEPSVRGQNSREGGKKPSPAG